MRLPEMTWAEALAALLPPLTAEEAAVLGQMAAKLDARLSATTTPISAGKPALMQRHLERAA